MRGRWGVTRRVIECGCARTHGDGEGFISMSGHNFIHNIHWDRFQTKQVNGTVGFSISPCSQRTDNLLEERAHRMQTKHSGN